MSASVITFNGQSLQDANTISERPQYHNFPDRSVDSLEVGRSDGSTFIDARFGAKEIPIKTVIRADTEAALTSAIDTFKQKLSMKQGTLSIQNVNESTTIQFVCTVKSMDVNRTALYAVIMTVFEVASGVGKSSAMTVVTATGITTVYYAATVTITGSYPASPLIKITLSTGGTCNLLRVNNTTTGGEITIAPTASTFADGDVIIIDCERKLVTLNGTNHDFTGAFPTFVVGDNVVTINFGGSGTGVDQSQEVSTSNSDILADTQFIAQGFKVSGNLSSNQVDLLLSQENQ